ncbi:hypothetical protein Lser_V15G17713 [Lactuca serriola]
MGPFLPSFGFVYILVAVDNVSKWVEAKDRRTDNAKVVVDFVKKNIFARFGTPKAIISDRGTHFCNRTLEAVLKKYGVTHQVSTTYHSQTNGQADASNKQIKGIIEKTIIPVKKDWSIRLDDALWAHRTSYKTYIEHRAYWAVKKLNMSMDEAGKKRKLDIQELEEIWNKVYENEAIYKGKTKAFHDKMISRKVFTTGQKVLLYHSCFKLISGKLRSRWVGPFVVTNVFDHGAIEIKSEQIGKIFKVNGHRHKPFYEGFQVKNEEVEVVEVPTYRN